MIDVARERPATEKIKLARQPPSCDFRLRNPGPLPPEGLAQCTVMTGRQCCRHVGTVTAACTAQVSDLRTTLWTCVFGCGVLLRSLSNQTPCSTRPAPLLEPAPAPAHTPPGLRKPRPRVTGDLCCGRRESVGWPRARHRHALLHHGAPDRAPARRAVLIHHMGRRC